MELFVLLLCPHAWFCLSSTTLMTTFSANHKMRTWETFVHFYHSVKLNTWGATSQETQTYLMISDVEYEDNSYFC